RAAVAGNQVQRANGYVEFRLVRVFDRHELGQRAVDLEGAQADVAPDAVIDVHDRRADVQLRQVANDLVRIDRTRIAAHVLVGARAEYLRLGDQRERVGPGTAFDRRDRERERRQRSTKFVERRDVGCLQADARQEFAEHFATAGRLRAEEHRYF